MFHGFSTSIMQFLILVPPRLLGTRLYKGAFMDWKNAWQSNVKTHLEPEELPGPPSLVLPPPQALNCSGGWMPSSLAKKTGKQLDMIREEADPLSRIPALDLDKAKNRSGQGTHPIESNVEDTLQKGHHPIVRR